MKRVIKVGTRHSALAVEQTIIAIEAMKAKTPDLEFELVYKKTIGDRILDKPLLSFGGKGVFVTEFEEALQSGEIDFAVHSAKDMPMELADGLAIVGVPKREDPRDVLIVKRGTVLKGRQGIVVGTSSLRRKVLIERQAEKLWPGTVCLCENLRGNVQTRLGKLDAGEFDAIILAAAGLKRLGLHLTLEYDYLYFDCDAFIPAGGQGILAIEGRLGDPLCEVAQKVNDREALLCLNLERRVLRLLNAGCHEPVGVYSYIEESQIKVSALYQRDGMLRFSKLAGGLGEAEKLARKTADQLLPPG